MKSQNFDLRFESLNTNDGLSQNSIQKILQDNNGYIWIATEDGLNRYNGYTIETFWADPSDTNSIISNYFDSDCLKDSEGNLWFTYEVEDGLSRYIGDGKFKSYAFRLEDTLSVKGGRPFYEDNNKNIWLTLRDSSKVKGLASLNIITNQIRSYSLDSIGTTSPINFYNFYSDSFRTLWLLTSKGMFICRNNKFKRFYIKLNDGIPEMFYAMTETEPGVYIISTEIGIIKYSRIKNESVYLFPMTFNTSEANRVLNFINTGDVVYVIFKKHPVFGLRNGQLLRENRNAYIKNIRYGERLELFQDSKSNMWMSKHDDNSGLTLYDPGGKSKSVTHNPLIPYSISDNKIRTVFEDSYGNIFVGTEKKGISIFYKDKNKFKWLKNIIGSGNCLASNSITSIETDKDNKLILGLGNAGFDIYSQAQDKFVHYNNLIFRGRPVSVSEVLRLSSTEFLLGTYDDGLFRFNAADGSLKRIVLLEGSRSQVHTNRIRVIYRDSNNRFWIGTSGGLFILNEKLEQIKSFFHGGKFSNRDIIYSIIEFDNHFAVATEDGVFIIDYEEGIIKHIRYDEEDINSLSHYSVFSLFYDMRGRLWAGTFGRGLNKIDLKVGKVTRYSTSDGLPNNTIYSIMEDENGLLWLGTGKGLSRFNPGTETFRNYNVDDGLPSNDINSSKCKDRSGRFYIGTQNGVVMFDPKEISGNNLAPIVRLTGFNILNTKVKLENELNLDSEIKLSYNDDIFSFDYVGINIPAPTRVNYSYKLEGYQEEWTNAGKQRRAIFMNVPPGSYEFKVKAGNEDDCWSADETKAYIYIMPPYWQTFWFRGLILLAITGILTGFYLYRVGQLKRIEKIRLKIADDLHDEIGSNLGSISIMSRTLKRKYNEETIDKILYTSQKSASAIRDIVWFINPQNDDAGRLLFKMKSFCEDTLEDINYKFIVEDDSILENLSLDKKRNIYLVLKESIHNIVKHAEARNVLVWLFQNDSRTVLQIKDDGKGFLINNNTGSGLKSIHKRVEEIGAELNIESTPQAGTSIKVVVN